LLFILFMLTDKTIKMFIKDKDKKYHIEYKEFNPNNHFYEVFDIIKPIKCWFHYNDEFLKLNLTPKRLYSLITKVFEDYKDYFVPDILLFCKTINNSHNSLVLSADIHLNNLNFDDELVFNAWLSKIELNLTKINKLENIKTIPYSKHSELFYYNAENNTILTDLKDFLRIRNIQDLFVQYTKNTQNVLPDVKKIYKIIRIKNLIINI